MDVYLYGRAADSDVKLRSSGYRDLFLKLRSPQTWGVHDVLLYAASRVAAVAEVLSPFPTQYAGLRYFSGTVKELCLVALGDAVGGVRVVKNGTTYGAYLVDTSDPNASGVRVQTGAGVKAIRLKT